MLFHTHTGNSGAYGARTLQGEAYRTTPVGIGLGSYPPTPNFPRRTAQDHHLPKVSLNDGLSEDLHAARTITNGFFYQG